MIVLQVLLVLDVQQFFVLLTHVFQHFVEEHEIQLDFYLSRVVVLEFLSVFVALDVVFIGLLEETSFYAKFSQKQIVKIDSLIIDFDILIDLDGFFSIFYGLVIDS